MIHADNVRDMTASLCFIRALHAKKAWRTAKENIRKQDEWVMYECKMPAGDRGGVFPQTRSFYIEHSNYTEILINKIN
jgi:hypothetical protein